MAPSFLQAAFLFMGVGAASAIANSNLMVLGKRAAPIVPAILPGTWTFQGCYTDSGPRTLVGAFYTSGNNMTDEYCIGFCEQNKYIYAGTEYGQECCKCSLHFESGAPILNT